MACSMGRASTPTPVETFITKSGIRTRSTDWESCITRLDANTKVNGSKIKNTDKEYFTIQIKLNTKKNRGVIETTAMECFI
jgi:hypothetical protein